MACMAKKKSSKESLAMDREAIVASMESLETWAMVFTFLVAIGVAGEFFVGFKQRRLSRLLRAAEDDHALAQERATAEANARAEEAKELAEKERLARVQIEERMRPRALTHPDLLVSAISAFSDTSQAIFIGCDADQQPIASAIQRTIFQSVHWHLVMNWSEQTRLPPGMTLYVAPDATPRDEKVAEALVAGLRAAGATDLEGPALGVPSVQAGANAKIALMIGAKK
jgi:hypothetical protein